jgi:hypothetical protein
MNDVIVKVCVIAYDFMLVAGTAYLVQEHGWSMWTFLLTILFFITTKREE